MTKVAITRHPTEPPGAEFRAAARGHESVGNTPGAALDALAQQLDASERNSFIIVRNMQPDEFFIAAQQRQLLDLLAKRRTALDMGSDLLQVERAELDGLIDTELDGAVKRAAAMVSELQS